MRFVLESAWHCMVELDECLFYIEDNGEVDLASLIISVNFNAEVALSFPIMGDSLMFLKDFHEVLCMIFANIFYSKVVNAKCEADWVSGMFPETGCK